MQAVVKAAHAQALQEEEAQRGRAAQPDQDAHPGAPASLPRRVPGTAGTPKPPNGVPRPGLPTAPNGRLPVEDAEFDTDPFLPRLTASGTIASPAINQTSAQPNHTAQQNHSPQQNHAAQQNHSTQQNHAAQRDDTVKPDHALRRERALRRRDRRATKRDRAAQAERERTERHRERAAQTERAERGRAEREPAEREHAQAEPAGQERAAQTERAQQERAAQTERAQQERAAQTERERAEREHAAQTEREHAAQTERENTALAERAERENAAQAERADREHAERERAAEAAWAEREHAAQAEHERAAQAERQRSGLAAATGGTAAAGADVAERAPQAQRTAAPDLTRPDPTTSPASTAKPADAAAPGSTARPAGTAPPTDRKAAAVRPPTSQPGRASLSVRKAPRHRRYRTIALAIGVAAALAAGPLALMLSRSSPAKPSAAAVTRDQAASWVAQQVSSDAVVSCDLTMCQTLRADGVPVGDLLVMGPKARDLLLSSQVIVSTAAIRSLLGSSLDSVYAPIVLASFGSGQARIDVRVIAPDGATAYRNALREDLQERKSAGEALADTSRLTLTPTARRQMNTGQVDAQVLIVITSLAAIHPLDILAFGGLAPGASPGVPLRSVTLAENGGAAITRSMVASLREQPSPYRAAHIETTQRNGQRVLVIEFTAPVPPGLINGPNP
jgi:hypothetical protein